MSWDVHVHYPNRFQGVHKRTEKVVRGRGGGKRQWKLRKSPPPGCCRSVTNFCGWGAHGAQLRCHDDVSDAIYERGVPGGALNLNPTGYPVLPWENSHGRTGSRTRDLMASSQKFWPPNNEAGQIKEVDGDTFIWGGGREKYRLLERSQASPARPYGSNMKMKMYAKGVWDATAVPRNKGREILLSL
jgi:hypothetical protein